MSEAHGSSYYRWCIVPHCKNTSIVTPEKTFIQVPKNKNRKQQWFAAARRDFNPLSTTSSVFVCEDHFDLENDMENYVKWKLMGGMKIMKETAVPHKFDCQPDRKRVSSGVPRSAAVKRSKMQLVEDALDAHTSKVVDVKEEPADYTFCDISATDSHQPFFDEGNTSTGSSTVKPEIEENWRSDNCFKNIKLEEVNVKVEELPLASDIQERHVEFVNCDVQPLAEENFHGRFCEVNEGSLKLEEVNIKVEKLPSTSDVDEEHVEFINCDIKPLAEENLFGKFCKVSETNLELPRVPNTPKTFPCNSCEYKSKSNANLLRHMLTHTGEKPFACHICDFRTAERRSLEFHVIAHSPNQPYVCSMCNYKTAHRRSLRRHMMIHTGEKPHTCHICNFRTADKATLQCHITTHTGQKPFMCSVCEYRTTRKDRLECHMKTHTGEMPFACSLCEYKTAHKRSLEHHKKTHSEQKPFVCSACDYKTVYKRNLQRHMNTHKDLNISVTIKEQCQ